MEEIFFPFKPVVSLWKIQWCAHAHLFISCSTFYAHNRKIKNLPVIFFALPSLYLSLIPVNKEPKEICHFLTNFEGGSQFDCVLFFLFLTVLFANTFLQIILKCVFRISMTAKVGFIIFVKNIFYLRNNVVV